MANAIFFSAGLGLGFVVGCITWAVAYWTAGKIAGMKVKGEIQKMRQDGILFTKELEEKKKAMLDIHGQNLTTRNKQIIEEETLAALGAMPRMPQGRR